MLLFKNKWYQWLCGLLFVTACSNVNQQAKSNVPISNEQHRPLIHFTPQSGWMNDPNGMVFYNGVYHLFYQYYPDSTVWGPMHWGHATSTDLMHWNHQPVALYPDSIGYIFSGSAIVDKNNTSGLAKGAQSPLIAVFTQHDPKGEKEGKTDFQNQSMAYSLDSGKSWTKYAGNPVLKNSGTKDFRDPKVSWHEETKRWIMTLATGDRITFYSSPDLKTWTKESEFGKDAGAHGGVWECPDLFPLNDGGKTIWVLTVSINPGDPNGGSATQYFTGSFDRHTFKPFDTTTRWIDYGPDDYAGVTWSNTGDKKIFLGWMSNWQYAQNVPTKTWRSAMTIPRELGVQKINERYFITSKPVAVLAAIGDEPMALKEQNNQQFSASLHGAGRLDMHIDSEESFSVVLSNGKGQKLIIGYDKQTARYFIDRTASGQTAFEKGFAAKHFAPRLTKNNSVNLTLIIDVASVELFADDGLAVMTEIFFPDEDFTQLHVQTSGNKKPSLLQFQNLALSNKK